MNDETKFAGNLFGRTVGGNHASRPKRRLQSEFFSCAHSEHKTASENAGDSRAFVPLNQTTESFAADDVIKEDCIVLGWWAGACWRQMAADRVCLLIVAIAEVFTDEVAEMLLAED